MIDIILSDLSCASFCIVLGFLLKAFYDFVKVFYEIHDRNKKSKVIRYVGDMLFFVCAAFSVFQIMLERYNGEFRWYTLFSIGFGAILHKKIICDNFVNNLCNVIFYIDSKIVRKLINLFVQNIKILRIVKNTYLKFLKIYHRCSKISLRPNSNE